MSEINEYSNVNAHADIEKDPRDNRQHCRGQRACLNTGT